MADRCTFGVCLGFFSLLVVGMGAVGPVLNRMVEWLFVLWSGFWAIYIYMYYYEVYAKTVSRGMWPVHVIPCTDTEARQDTARASKVWPLQSLTGVLEHLGYHRGRRWACGDLRT